MSESNNNVDFIFGAIAGPLVVGVLAIYQGFVFQCLWNWFAQPYTAIWLSLPMAIGASCLVSFLRGSRYQKSEKGDHDRTIYALTQPGVLLLVGFFAHVAVRY